MKYKVQMYYTKPDPEEIDLEFDRQIRVYEDCLPGEIRQDEITILYIVEPNEIYGLGDYAVANYNDFDFILTSYNEVLDACPNAIRFEFGSTWIHGYKFKEKKFGVSTIVGNKQKTYGHLLRYHLWLRRNEITIPACFYISAHGGPKNTGNCPTLGKEAHKKHIAFDTQYHIAIENVSKDYWFTEKLIDCFRTKAVPIYWGCPAIGDYFNTDGMIIINDADEMIRKVNSLRPGDYEKMADAIEENYELSKEFADSPRERMKGKLKELIELAGPARSRPTVRSKA